MKNTLVAGIGVLMISFTISLKSIAQHTNKLTVQDAPEFISRYFGSKTEGDSMMDTSVVYINIKAVRHFVNSFPNAEDVHWFKAQNCTVAYYTMNGIKSRALYDTKGHWLCTISTFPESRLSKKVRDLVKRTYYDYCITWVNEISYEQQTNYIIQLEDATTLKTIRFCDGEINLIKEYMK